jgi:polysaccharide pyruvyl transferase WcaK-like protein
MIAPEVYLLHAYSSRNSGDGLLVKLSLKAIRAAGVRGTISVVCLDRDSFVGYLDDADLRLMTLGEFLSGRVTGIHSRRPAVFFGVGGGYLRSSSHAEGLKALLAHGTQILCSKLGGPRRLIYLPQSVGPFNVGAGGMLGGIVRRHVDTIFLRDDKSIEELNHRRGIRTGDLVVLEIAKKMSRRFVGNVRGLPRIVFVFRDLSSKAYNAAYIANIGQLMALIPDAIFAIQSSGRGNSDDVFYERTLGVKQYVLLKDVLAEGNAVVVSVRLHGSLESILAGVPSMHLAYERKGRAAFADLGLELYAFHASDFDPHAVAWAARSLAADPDTYWSNMTRNAPDRYEQFIEAIRNDLREFAHPDHGW